ncbi:Mov34/MPN/PAD-1 family protein [Acidimicrobium ferrooxidans DSM 10331]|uniref:Mov34/MPN/PAD-1 family protein n=1 Tax=Acidimicrobium ferrooxidans (strain DSM 10331 / JCM 15462 / NBRC 103882 / ICP) TaxID=525909 RepID=C7M111_ACIFD|nr:M67 family metallopeptidase [Acidimicrobium ferrooxidans]ACU54669.1 Mov34/MPN/PAD-1 family protein [Acidimicrobium ferrooxidans DSM 10331]
MVRVADGVLDAIAAHCLRTYPLEACGLLLGDDRAIVEAFPGRNEAHSARVFTMAPEDVLRAEQRAERAGLEIVGVFHSHTHSEAFPSPTDVRQAVDDRWVYVIASLARPRVDIRAYRISRGLVREEQVVQGASSGGG